MHPALRHYYYYSSSSEAFVSADGSGVGTQSDPYGPSEFEAALATIPTGTTVKFKKGDTFELGGLTVPQNNMTFSSYGSGADPILIGSTDLGGATWTSETGGYYSTPLATAPLWVTKDGVMSRQGESAWIPATANTTSTIITGSSVTLNAFNTVQSLVGAKVRIKEFPFRLSYEVEITAYNTGTGQITYTGNTISGGGTGMPFKIYGQKQFATTEGDWWYDEANEELWIKTASTPAGTDIRVVTEDRAFTVDQKSGVTFSGLEFAEYYQEAIYGNDSDTLSITGCNIHDIRTNGVYLKLNGDGVTISGTTITRCGLNAISSGAIQNYTIASNTIHTIGEQGNIGWPLDTSWLKTGGCAVAFAWNSELAGANRTPNNGVIELNTMYDLGYCGVLLMGDDNVVRKNVVYNFCEKWNDGGGLYIIHRSSLGSSTKNNVIQNNIVYGGLGNVDGISGATLHAIGIYIDNGCELNTVDSNTVTDNAFYGILVNWDTQNTTITNNNVYDNNKGEVIFRQDTDIADSPVFANNDGNVFTGNTIVSLTAGQYCVEAVSFNGSSTYNPFSDGGSSDNNHYISPLQEDVCGSRTSDGGAVTGYTLTEWQSHISGDAASNEILETFSTTLNINASNAVEEVTIGSGYMDGSGTPITSNSTPAFYSVIYTGDPSQSYLFDTFTGANGTAISGRAPNVGNTPTIISGTHSIQSNRMSTSVNGMVMWNIGTSSYIAEVAVVVVTAGTAIMRVDLRYLDTTPTTTNRLIFYYGSGNLKLEEYDGNGAVPNNTWTAAYTLTAGTKILKFEANGTSIKVYVDNVLYIEETTTVTTGNYFAIVGQSSAQTIETVSVYPV